MSKLNNKRKRVLLIILAAISGNALVAATPSVNLETIKQIFISLSNIAMFVIVWDAYFDEQLSKKNLRSILQDLFTVTCICLITNLVVSQVIVKTSGSLTTILGSGGWLVTGAIAAIATAMLGIIWAFYCDDLYRDSV